jgi:hypothetical protein
MKEPEHLREIPPACCFAIELEGQFPLFTLPQPIQIGELLLRLNICTAVVS